MAGKLVIIANPGSSSRKYAVYRGAKRLAFLHFETERGQVVYSLQLGTKPASEPRSAGITHVTFAATTLRKILEAEGVLEPKEQPDAIGLRVVAPSSFFTAHRRLTAKAIELLKLLEPYAELHINATLQEVNLLSTVFPKVSIVGASDSAFHAGRPAHALAYAISPTDAKTLDIWRYGYHGLSVNSIVSQLRDAKLLPKRVIVCHVGSGVSVTAVLNGKSLDTTMGYSPLEGPVMATRTGSIDPAATQVIARRLKLNETALELYLNTKSGLKGLSGSSSDIRELLEKEGEGDTRAALALDMFVYRLQQSIGQMAAVLKGVDGIVFTGTVGERSVEMRQRIASGLLYLGLSIDHRRNASLQPGKIEQIQQARHPAPVFVVPTNEAASILQAISEAK